MPDDVVVENSQDFVFMGAQRRPLTPAPSDGPVSESVPQAVEAGDPTVPLGGFTIPHGEVGRGAPLLPPTPAPFPVALHLIPTVYRNPNHYEFPRQMGGRGVVTPLASPARGEQLAYELRQDWRRVQPITHAPITVGGGLEI